MSIHTKMPPDGPIAMPPLTVLARAAADATHEKIAQALGDRAPGSRGFEPFGTTHAVTFAVCAAVLVALGFAAFRLRGTAGAMKLHRAWLGAVVLVQTVNIVYFATPPRLDPKESLPLHICDLAGIVAVVALWSRWRPWAIIMYYWGIGLSTQGFFTPVVQLGPASFRFHLLFWSHITIVGTGVYLLASGRFRPSWRDLRTAILINTGYLLLMLPLNIATGWNYGYVGETKPVNPTLIDRLGPWPLRVVWLWLITAGLCAGITLPWVIRRPVKREA